MKKITALVLALVMTLTLLPMNVWAEGEEPLANDGKGFNTNGVAVFTENGDAGLSRSIPVDWIGDDRVGVTCYPAAISNVYLVTPHGNDLEIYPAVTKTLIGTTFWAFGTEELCDVYEVTVPSHEDGEYTSEASVTRSWGSGENDNYTFTLVFDFRPVFMIKEDSRNAGDCGVNVFTSLDSDNKTLFCDSNVQQNGNRITVSCPNATSGTVYLTADGELSVNNAQVTPLGGKWIDGHRTCSIYSLTVSNPGNNGTVSYTVSHGGGSFTLIFDFMPVLSADGGCNVGDFYVFTDLVDGVLTCDRSMDEQWHENGEGIDITVPCSPASEAPDKVYLAVGDWQTLDMTGATMVGKWKTEAHWDSNQMATYNVYSIAVTEPTTGDITVKSGSYTYNDENGEERTCQLNIIFDYTPVLTGDTFREIWSLKLFTDLNGSELSYNGGVEQWGDESGEHVTVYCAPETSETIYLGVGAQNTLTLNGNEPANAIGKWSRNFFAEWSQQEETETLNIYPLTVSKPADGDTVEYTVVNSWDWYDNNNTPDNDSDDSGGTEIESFTLIFDFVNYPSDPLFIKDGEDYIDFADVLSGFAYDWQLYYMEWDENMPIYHPFEDSSFTFEATDASGMDCSDKFSWNADGTLHFDGVSFTYDELPITLFVMDNNGYRHRLVIEDNFHNGQDQTYWKTYTTNVVTEGDYTYGGYSTFTVQLSPEQKEFIDLPDKLTASNELVITVHDPGEAGWREQVGLGLEGLAVFYQYDVKRGIKDGEMPRVKQVGGPWSAPDFFDVLYKPEYPIEDYLDGRGNGNIFGKVFYETDKIVVIPEESEIRSAWIWMYSDGTQLADSVNVKLVFADDIGGAVTLDDESLYPAVDISRVTVLETGLEDVLSFKENNGGLAYENGTLTYCYTGPTSILELENAFVTTVADYVIRSKAQEDDYLGYNLLTVSAPDVGYTLKALNGRQDQAGRTSVYIYYEWEGLAIENTYTLVWVNSAGKEYVEQITIETPAIDGTEWWMDHLYGGTVGLIDDERMLVTEFDENSGAEHKFSDGFAFVQFDNEAELDVSTIKDAEISIQAPKDENGNLPVAYRSIWFEDASRDEPFYNPYTEGWIEKIEGQVESIDRLPLGENSDTIAISLKALLKQTIGDIEYYYSGDRGTRIIVVKWIYDLEAEDDGAVYEYLRLDTSPYYCTLKSALSNVGDNVVADKPMADVTQIPEGNIYLETRIHPQEEKGGKYGQYFFELRLIDGEGNTFVEYHEDGYTIILPYSFMGEEWNYEMAKNLKEKPIINHYDKNYKQLAGNMGAITGEYTERGIEFVVDSFSPFMLTWDETVKDTTPSYPGYYPIVTPDKETVEKPAETKPVVQPTTPPAEDDVTPMPEDTTPDVVPDVPPVVDDGAVDEAPSDDATQSGGAGLWIGIGLVALVAAVVVLIIMATRKKRRES